MEIKLANIEREKKEDNLRQLAQKARDARAGIRAPANEGTVYVCVQNSVVYDSFYSICS